MKKTIIVPLLLVIACSAFGKPVINGSPGISACYVQQDSLSIYTGKYQSVQKAGVMMVEVAIVKGQLVATAMWDGSKLSFKRLEGDNFMVFGRDWSIKFLRDKDNTIGQLIVAGATTFTKIKK